MANSVVMDSVWYPSKNIEIFPEEKRAWKLFWSFLTDEQKDQARRRLCIDVFDLEGKLTARLGLYSYAGNIRDGRNSKSVCLVPDRFLPVGDNYLTQLLWLQNGCLNKKRRVESGFDVAEKIVFGMILFFTALGLFRLAQWALEYSG